MERSTIFLLTNLDRAKGLCRFCGKPIPAGSRRISYCSSECAEKTYEKYFWEKVKKAVWLRDEKRCQFPGCGIELSLGEAQCHHKIPIRTLERIVLNELRKQGPIDDRIYRRELLERAVDKNNLITHCTKHHGIAHSKYNMRSQEHNDIPVQFLDFFKLTFRTTLFNFL